MFGILRRWWLEHRRFYQVFYDVDLLVEARPLHCVYWHGWRSPTLLFAWCQAASQAPGSPLLCAKPTPNAVCQERWFLQASRNLWKAIFESIFDVLTSCLIACQSVECNSCRAASGCETIDLRLIALCHAWISSINVCIFVCMMNVCITFVW